MPRWVDISIWWKWIWHINEIFRFTLRNLILKAKDNDTFGA